MNAFRVSAPRLVASFALVACVACSELGNAPVVRFGSRSLTAEDLRVAYADLDPTARPSLATREDRRAFVQRLVERTLLVDEGERLLASDSAGAADSVPERQAWLVRRLRALEADGAPIESVTVAAAYERMRTSHRVEIYFFAREEEARTAKASADAGREVQASERHDTWVSWSPFPDPVADLVVDLPIGGTAGPLRVGGGWRLVRVIERKASDPGPLESLRARIFQGLRARRESEAVQSLGERLRAVADVRVSDAAVDLLAARTGDAILRPGSTEQDDEWAIPTMSAGEESTRVATWRDGSLDVRDYLQALRRVPRNQRPRVGLREDVRRMIEGEVTTRLLFAEAERRGVADDHWVRRALDRARQERALQRAMVEIQRSERSHRSDSSSEALAVHLLETRPELFERAPRARVLRFDFPDAEAGRAEMARIRRAGGAEARLREILAGDVPGTGPYHLFYLTPTEMPSREVASHIFGAGPGTVTGPHRQGEVWVVLACLELRPSARPTRDEIVAEFRRAADTNDMRLVTDWLDRRKKDIGVQVDDSALDALAPGG